MIYDYVNNCLDCILQAYSKGVIMLLEYAFKILMLLSFSDL